MNRHAVDKLKFHQITRVLAEQCATRLGARLAERIEPVGDRHRIAEWLEQVSQMMELESPSGLPPLAGMRPLESYLDQTAQPGGLDGESLATVRETLMAGVVLRRWLESLPDAATVIKSFLPRVADLSALADEIHRCIDPRGLVRDIASERLSNLRRAIESARSEIRSVYDRILSRSGLVKCLQYGGTTFHGDRLVLPLKAEQRGRIPGIVHRSSDSGSTLFVEPSQAVELNNRIAHLKSKELEEERVILSALSRKVHRQAPEITELLDAASVLDLIGAKVRYAHQAQAICASLNDHGVLDLRAAHNPILLDLQLRHNAERSVVPIDVRLGEDFDVLVITGPNTGGKTVSIMTVGLLVLMNQAGIPIPAASSSTLPVYSQIYVDIGDEQNIEQSLSTFSAHMTNILPVLRDASRGSLVLLDELGAGTDPDEGAAIGQAVIEELLDRRCHGIVSTHLSQLKTLAFHHDRVDNASVEFDSLSLSPTYVLRMGEPGNSNAIQIAERLGMPSELIVRVRQHLDKRQQMLTRAIEGTTASRRRFEAARTQAAQAKQEAEKSRDDYQKRAHELQTLQQEYQGWVEWINGLKPGDWVYMQNFEKHGRISRMKLHKQQAIVSTGALECEVAVNTLRAPLPQWLKQRES